MVAGRLIIAGPEPRKSLRGWRGDPRQLCHGQAAELLRHELNNRASKCSQTRIEAQIETSLPDRLDCQAAMLQAIEIDRGTTMLEPWIIDEIRRREEERRRGSRPQLELPIPEENWPSGEEPRVDHDERGDRAPERGVVIIGM